MKLLSLGSTLTGMLRPNDSAASRTFLAHQDGLCAQLENVNGRMVGQKLGAVEQATNLSRSIVQPERLSLSGQPFFVA